MRKKKPELLAPAGDWISLRAAVLAGADAVYFGIKGLNMRAGTANFSLREIGKIVSFCHENGSRAYLALNVIIYEDEIRKTKEILSKAKEAGIDAVIAWDFSVLKECKKLGIRMHLSTQASVSNYESLEYYAKKTGISRAVLARECTLDDLKAIIRKKKKNRLKCEIEAFIHGAMCVSISGRCFMSQFLYNRSANKGECIQPCRRSYIVRDPEEGSELEVTNNYVLSPKDLCTMPFLDKLIDSGIDSFKIEGRNRSPEYVKTVVASYREAIDSYFSKPVDFRALRKDLTKRLSSVYNRGFSPGFYMGRPIEDWTDAYGSKATTRKQYIGKVLNYYPKARAAMIQIESCGLKAGEKIMFQGNKTGVHGQTAGSIQLNHKDIKNAEKGEMVAVKTTNKVRKNDKVYKIISSSG